MSLDSQDRPRNVKPPRLAKWLLARLLPRPNGEYMLGDLDEEFAARVQQPAGLRGARAWYWRQVRTALAERRPPQHLVRDERPYRRATMLDTLRQDVRYALRGLRQHPGFTSIVVLVLALGIGANTAIFSLFDAVALRRLPVERPEELVLLGVQHEDGVDPSFNYPLFEDYRDRNEVFSALVAFNLVPMNLTLERESERLLGTQVSWNFFAALGARPVIGRSFLAEEDRVGAPAQVVVIGYELWQSRFNGQVDAVGHEVLINGHRFTIIGVAPPRFTGVFRGLGSDLYIPIALDEMANPGRPSSRLDQRTSTWLQVFGRLKPGISREQAQTAMRTLATQIKQVEPMNTYESIVVSDGSRGFTEFVDDLEQPLQLMQWIVALVLAIACANVANLQLSRAMSRRKEVAIRLAMGAGSGRLVRQFLTESVLLSVAGGACGLLVAWWLSGFLQSFQSGLQIAAALDLRVLGFTLGVTLLVGVLFGLAPAWQLARTALVETLKDERAVGGSKARAWLRQGLVVAQIGLSLVVLVAAGLCVKSLRALLNIDSGYDAEKIMMFSVDLGRSGYSEERGQQFYTQVLERVRALPQVEGAAVGRVMPLSGGGMRTTTVPEGQILNFENPINLNFNIVTPGYFATAGIPLRRGRDFNTRDTAGAPAAVIVNEAVVNKFWPGHDGLGKYIDMPTGFDTPAIRLQVVGVVADSKYRTLTEATQPSMFLAMAQNYENRGILLVRGEHPSALVEPVRATVRSLDATLPVYGIRTLAEERARSISTPRMAASLLSLLGGLGLLLGTLGLYGVMAYAVAQRTHEIGIRIALGAERSDVLRLVLRQGLRLVAFGMILGVAGALAAKRLIESLLYQVRPEDPQTIALVAALLAAAALVACYLPARRATRVDPMVALRYE